MTQTLNRLVGFGLLVLIAAIAVSALPFERNLTILVFAVLILVIGIIGLVWKLVNTSPVVIAVLGAFAALDFALWKSGWLPDMYGWPGILHIPIYLAYIFVGHLIDVHTKGRTRRGAFMMWFIGLAILGISHIPQERWERVWRWVGGSSVQQTAFTNRHTTDTCPGGRHPKTLDSRWQVINPTRSCRIVYDFPNGSVELDSSDGSFTNAGWQTRRTLPASIRAAAGTVSGHYGLCPVSASRRVNWDCSSL